MQPDPLGEDLVTITEISKIANKARSTVSNWVRRHPDFPDPAGQGAKGPLFRRAAILKWLNANDKIDGDLKVDWPEPGGLRSNTPGSASAVWSDAVHHLRHLVPWGEFVALALAALAGHPTPQDSPEALRVFPNLLVAAEKLTAPERVAAADGLIASPPPHTHDGIHATPSPVAQLMAGLLGVRSDVYDPASGIGVALGANFFVDSKTRLYGQEINDLTVESSRFYLELLGADAQIESGDSLRDDHFAGQQFHGIVATPPLGQRLDRDTISEADPRWALSTPTRNADEAWLQHVLYHLEPGGRAVIQVSHSVLFASGNMGQLRTALIRSGNLRGVIQLPRGCVPGTQMQSALVVLERPEQVTMSPRVLVADPELRPLGRHGWNAEDSDFVITVVRSWLDGAKPSRELPTGYRSVDLEELANVDFDLTPRRLLTPVVVEVPPLERVLTEFDQAVEAAQPAIKSLGQRLERVRSMAPNDVIPLPRVPFDSIANVSVQRAMSPRQLADTGEVPVHNPQSVLTGGQPGQFLPVSGDKVETPRQVQPGEILLVIDGPHLGAVHLVTEAIVASPHFAVIRTSKSEIDCRYLALWLCGSEAQSQISRSTTGTTLRRVAIKDVRQLAIPVPNMEHQHQIGELYDQISAIKSVGAEVQSGIGAISDIAVAAVGAALPVKPEGQ